eukprot:scaffold1112_cov92-Amphora_coffeaeformis.AAC.8
MTSAPGKRVHFAEALESEIPFKTLFTHAPDATEDADDGGSVSSIDSGEEEETAQVVRPNEFIETVHGEERRKQRQIAKIDLEMAMKYGTKQVGLGGRIIYKHEGLTFVYDPSTKQEITSWFRPEAVARVPIDPQTQESYEDALSRLNEDLTLHRSHTVIVVDTSGSMRQADVLGARNRLKAVWMSIAIDYIAHQLEAGAKDEYDVVSIILLGTQASTLCEAQPWTWILYNFIVDTYEGYAVQPHGPGPFMPSLRKVHELFNSVPDECALALAFFSDGAPSDAFSNRGHDKDQWNELLCAKICQMASEFGPRLSFMAIPIGKRYAYNLLQDMVDRTKEYSVDARCVESTFSVVGMGGALTSLATSLTATQMAMTHTGTLNQRAVCNVQRERQSNALVPIEKVNPTLFHIYDIFETEVKRWRFEHALQNGRQVPISSCDQLDHPDAEYVAICKMPFGEGKECFVYRLYELACDGKTVVGKPKVAKESRYKDDYDRSWKARRRMAERDCRKQQLARRLALEFNEKTEGIPSIHPETPTVGYLDCSVYTVEDRDTGRKRAVLVEDMLFGGEWKKWNSNNGQVSTSNSSGPPGYIKSSLRGLLRRSLDVCPGTNIIRPNKRFCPDTRPPVLFDSEEVAQAFSHFTFCASGGKRLVCDLQGMYDEDHRRLRLSDPVIHYFNYGKERRTQRHGRTDLGRAGMAMFQHSHECNPLCHLVIRGFRTVEWHDTDESARVQFENQTRCKRRRQIY